MSVRVNARRIDALTRDLEKVALMDEAQDPFAGAEVLYAYTRKDALADGVQIDMRKIVREAGLKFPVYLTRAVWFGLHVRNDNRDRTPPLVNLKAVCGARDIDDPQPAITVMLPDED